MFAVVNKLLYASVKIFMKLIMFFLTGVQQFTWIRFGIPFSKSVLKGWLYLETIHHALAVLKLFCEKNIKYQFLYFYLKKKKNTIPRINHNSSKLL